MTLPILNPAGTDFRGITERVNVLIRDYNREDVRIPIYAPANRATWIRWRRVA
jgi:hypothetical protein